MNKAFNLRYINKFKCILNQSIFNSRQVHTSAGILLYFFQYFAYCTALVDEVDE